MDENPLDAVFAVPDQSSPLDAVVPPAAGADRYRELVGEPKPVDMTAPAKQFPPLPDGSGNTQPNYTQFQGTDVKKYIGERIPGYGSVASIVDNVQAIRAANRVRAGEGTDEDRQLLRDREAEQQRLHDRSLGRMILDNVTAAPGAVAEWMLSGGAGAAGRGIAGIAGEGVARTVASPFGIGQVASQATAGAVPDVQNGQVGPEKDIGKAVTDALISKVLSNTAFSAIGGVPGANPVRGVLEGTIKGVGASQTDQEGAYQLDAAKKPSSFRGMLEGDPQAKKEFIAEAAGFLGAETGAKAAHAMMDRAQKLESTGIRPDSEKMRSELEKVADTFTEPAKDAEKTPETPQEPPQTAEVPVKEPEPVPPPEPVKANPVEMDADALRTHIDGMAKDQFDSLGKIKDAQAALKTATDRVGISGSPQDVKDAQAAVREAKARHKELTADLNAARDELMKRPTATPKDLLKEYTAVPELKDHVAAVEDGINDEIRKLQSVGLKPEAARQTVLQAAAEALKPDTGVEGRPQQADAGPVADARPDAAVRAANRVAARQRMMDQLRAAQARRGDQGPKKVVIPKEADNPRATLRDPELPPTVDDQFKQALDVLPERSRAILSDRMSGKSLEDIGKDLGLTRERVRQLQGEALKKLNPKTADAVRLKLNAEKKVDPEAAARLESQSAKSSTEIGDVNTGMPANEIAERGMTEALDRVGKANNGPERDKAWEDYRKFQEMTAPKAGRLSPSEIEEQIGRSILEDIEGQPGMGAARARDQGGQQGLMAQLAQQFGDKAGAIYAAAKDAVVKKTTAIKDNFRELGGAIAPRTARKSERSATSIANLLGVPAAAEQITPMLAKEVVGKATDYKVPEAEMTAKDRAAVAKDFMTALVETRLRYAREQYQKKAAEATDPTHKEAYQNLAEGVGTLVGVEGRLGGEKQYQDILANKGYKEFLQRWTENVDPLLQKYYRDAKGLGADDPIDNLTQLPGLTFNAKAIMEGEKGVDVAKTLQTSRGNLRNQRNNKLPFDVQFKGSAEGYDVDPMAVIENSIARSAKTAAKAKMYRTLQEEGLMSVGERPKGLPDGRQWQELPDVFPNKIGRERAAWIHPDAYKEVRKALQLDDPYKHLPGTDLTTKAALLSLVEGAYHTKNLTSMMVRAGVSPVSFVKNLYGVISKNADVQKQVIALAEGGMLKPRGPESASFSLLKPIGDFIDIVDKSMRLTMDQAFTGLTKRPAGLGKVVDTPTARRDFVNQLGNYLKGGQNDMVAFFRDVGIGPFATAGFNFNVQGLRTLAGSPGVKAASKTDAVSLRAEAITRAAGAIGFVALANYLAWGKPSGDDNTPFGAVKVGENNGKTQYIDIADMVGLKRGLRSTGLLAVGEGARSNTPVHQVAERAVSDVLHGADHPMIGPAAQFAEIAATGKNAIGMDMVEKKKDRYMLKSVGLQDYEPLAKLQAALMNANPVLAVITGADRPWQKDDSILDKLGRMVGPYGVKERSSPPVHPTKGHR